MPDNAPVRDAAPQKLTAQQIRAFINSKDQWRFQRRQLSPQLFSVNIGCDIDPALLRPDFGAVNVDVNRWSGSNNRPTMADRIHDVRKPFPCAAIFDVAVLGDLLEHFTDEDVALALQNTVAILRSGGRVVVTCPEDHRSLEEQADSAEHVPGVPKHHPRPVTDSMIRAWLEAAGLTLTLVESLEYGFCKGWGVVGVKK